MTEVNDVQNPEIPAAVSAVEAADPTTVNEFGCYCGELDLCDLCSEVIDVEYITEEDEEEKHYPHISEFKYPLTPAETQATFRNFISRVSR